jgi:hypothetical protein
MSVMWNISIACPNVTTVTATEKAHLSAPLFYARAYGPAILLGYPQTLSGIVHQGQPYSQTQISFAIMDPGLYTVEVVLESIVSPNFNTLDGWKSPLYYQGFLLRGFPLILNVTSSAVGCNTAKTCNMTFCRGKDIESDLTSSSGRWIVVGHRSQVHTDRPLATDKDPKEHIYQKYVDGSHRLSIVTDYKPIHCVLVPLQSSIALINTCVEKTGIHYILMGDSVTAKHIGMLQSLLNVRNRITLIDVGCK